MCRLRFVGYWGWPSGCPESSPVVRMRDKRRVGEIRNICLDIDADGAPVSHLYLALMRHDGTPVAESRKDMLRVSERIPAVGIISVDRMLVDFEGIWRPSSGDNLFRLVAGAFDADENLLTATTSSMFRVMTRRTSSNHEQRRDSLLVDFENAPVFAGWAY